MALDICRRHASGERQIMGLREAVGSALLSSHLETIEERESAVDRVGALARATKLGSAMWRWKYALDASSQATALSALLRKAQRRTKVYKHHKDFPILMRACKLVLSEWYTPNCRTCGGRGEFVDEEQKLRIVCQSCEGLGTHRFSDRERIAALKVSPESYRVWADRIGQIWLCLAGADAGTSVVCRYQLERR